MPHVGQVGQAVVINLMVQVVDGPADLIPHALEGAGQGADLILSAVIQIHVIVLVGQALGRVGQLFEGRGEEPHEDRDQDGVEHDGRRRNQQDVPNQGNPGRVDFFCRRNRGQLHAV